MPDSPILKSLEDGILTLTISRPEALNALNRQVIDALAAAIEAAQDNAEVRVIVLTGAGEERRPLWQGRTSPNLPVQEAK